MDSVYHDLVYLVRSNPSLLLLMPFNIPHLIWESIAKRCKASSLNQIRVQQPSNLCSNDPIYPVFILSHLLTIAQRPNPLSLPLRPRVVKTVPGSMERS